jgi:hypothetical protein
MCVRVEWPWCRVGTFIKCFEGGHIKGYGDTGVSELHIGDPLNCVEGGEA